jgi:hypothetical protein
MSMTHPVVVAHTMGYTKELITKAMSFLNSIPLPKQIRYNPDKGLGLTGYSRRK